jgi:triacylglycerol lipase
MSFDAQFAREILIPINTTAYQLSWNQKLTFPPGWTQTGDITTDQSVIDAQTASGLARIVISENCDWGAVARKDDVSVIAIRGTDTRQQWWEDFRALAQPVAHEQWWVHEGFHDVWNLIAASLQKAWDTACSNGARVYITGHSLGAAIALMMGVHHPEANTWTFAGPAVYSPLHGLPPAANVVRVVNPDDLVPKVPLPPLYEHIGQEIQIQGAADRLDAALQHSLDTYSVGLGKMAQALNRRAAP